MLGWKLEFYESAFLLCWAESASSASTLEREFELGFRPDLDHIDDLRPSALSFALFPQRFENH